MVRAANRALHAPLARNLFKNVAVAAASGNGGQKGTTCFSQNLSKERIIGSGCVPASCLAAVGAVRSRAGYVP